MLIEQGQLPAMLDGDMVRTHFSKGLGYSKEDRDTNILRIGHVAAEIVRSGGIAVCATISPYAATRERVRTLVGTSSFIEVFVNTPLDLCEKRDPKGLYAKARIGEINNFTGIDAPYEPPRSPDLEIQTTSCTPEYNAHLILEIIEQKGLAIQPW